MQKGEYGNKGIVEKYVSMGGEQFPNQSRESELSGKPGMRENEIEKKETTANTADVKQSKNKWGSCRARVGGGGDTFHLSVNVLTLWRDL